MQNDSVENSGLQEDDKSVALSFTPKYSLWRRFWNKIYPYSSPMIPDGTKYGVCFRVTCEWSFIDRIKILVSGKSMTNGFIVTEKIPELQILLLYAFQGHL